MKKIYIKPSAEIYKLSPIHHIVEGSIELDNTPGTEDIDVGDVREDNSDNSNGGNIWDNAW